MKYQRFLTGLVMMAALVTASCRRSSTTSSEAKATIEMADAKAAASKDGTGHEPIPNTSPEGSKMDPSSNAYIVFDGSGSMAGKPIQEAKNAIAAFVASAPEDLNLGLAVFDSQNYNANEIVPLGRGAAQRKTLQTKISQISAGGGTPLGSAIQIGTKSLIQQFQKQLRYGDVRLIVVTDGQASDGAAFTKGIAFARANHVPIYTIGFRIKNSHPLRQYSEAYFTADDEQELLGAMKETLAELDDSVSIDL
jgi:Ca-activated chloride channel homolog